MRNVYLLTFVISLLVLSSFLIQVDDGKILWGVDVNLTYSDFKKEPPIKDSTYFAMSRIERTIQYQIENGIPIFMLKTFFVKDSSFIFIKNSNTLEHEQVHFDIAELYTRKMRRDMEQLQLEAISEIDCYFEIITKRLKESDQTDSLFDTQCRGLVINGQIIEREFQSRQKEWADSIDNELSRLEKYELK